MQSLGNGVMMSAIFFHEESEERGLEQKFAEFLGYERSIICQSGWVANVGLIQSIADESTPVF